MYYVLIYKYILDFRESFGLLVKGQKERDLHMRKVPGPAGARLLARSVQEWD